jgi:site-specific DNA-methyltransferase (adenine-specific)
MIPFPNKKYKIIYADPPWEVKRGPDWNSNGPSKPLPYSTMKVEEIASLPVNEISEKDSHLYLWTINKYIEDSYDIARKWGFSPVCLLTWCKPKHGLGIGGAFVQTSEHLLFCRKGKLKTQKRIDTTWFLHKRLAHSVKPDLFRQIIVETSGDISRIELFARNQTPGWDVWGNEVDMSKNKVMI